MSGDIRRDEASAIGHDIPTAAADVVHVDDLKHTRLRRPQLCQRALARPVDHDELEAHAPVATPAVPLELAAQVDRLGEEQRGPHGELGQRRDALEVGEELPRFAQARPRDVTDKRVVRSAVRRDEDVPAAILLEGKALEAAPVDDHTRDNHLLLAVLAALHARAPLARWKRHGADVMGSEHRLQQSSPSAVCRSHRRAKPNHGQARLAVEVHSHLLYRPVALPVPISSLRHVHCGRVRRVRRVRRLPLFKHVRDGLVEEGHHHLVHEAVHVLGGSALLLLKLLLSFYECQLRILHSKRSCRMSILCCGLRRKSRVQLRLLLHGCGCGTLRLCRGSTCLFVQLSRAASCFLCRHAAFSHGCPAQIQLIMRT